jgi:hypothetical protein
MLEGKVKIEVYNDEGEMLKTLTLQAGDAILLASGGHRVKVLEDAKIIEVKQGPYAGFVDKDYF